MPKLDERISSLETKLKQLKVRQQRTFAPLASRGRYLPRTPPEKSYSARIASPSVFFIARSFVAGRPPCIDNSHSAATVGMGDYHDTLVVVMPIIESCVTK